MQLQKLVYICNGWSLHFLNRSLTIDKPEAWRFGPVYRLLWNRLKYAGNDPITREIPNDEILPYSAASIGIDLDDEFDVLVQEVYSAYGKFEAFELSAFTHASHTPWTQVYRNGSGENAVIPERLIQAHFQGLVNAA